MKHNRNKGFTLVELIVVLLILGILIALLIPALTGYIEKARKKKVLSEARQAVVSAQTLYSEHYADSTTTVDEAAIQKLAEVDGTISNVMTTDGNVLHLTYTNSNYIVTYCKEYKTCSLHDELYNFIDGDSTPEDEKKSDKTVYYFTGVNGEKVGIAVSGDLEELQANNQYGFSVEHNSVVYYQGDYYWIYNGPYFNSNIPSILASNGLKMPSSISTPSSSSTRGDIRYSDGKYQMFLPYSSYPDAYKDSHYWVTLSTF